MDKKPQPEVIGYNTGKVIIGAHYVRPLCKQSNEDEHWQGVLLGDYQRQKKFNAQLGWYVAALFVAAMVLLTTCGSRSI